MTPQDVVDLGRNAIIITLLLSAPALLTGMIVGLLIGLLQALTQIQEQTVAFVPKLLATFLVAALALPWMLSKMTDYVTALFNDIPRTL